MTDIEKAIKGLEEILDYFDIYRNEKIDYYSPAKDYCNAAENAIAMLKEQEPRILDWDEIKNYSVVYGEFKGIKDIYPLIITLDNNGRPLSWNPCINTSEEFLFLVYDEEDRKNTRCWNKEPTEEQRQAVKWDA